MENNNLKNLAQIVMEAMHYYDLNVDKLSRLTGISERFLNALLEEKFKELPAAPYIHGYLKQIAKILNLNGEELWRLYLKNHQLLRRSGENDKLPSNRFAHHFWLNRSIIVAAILMMILLAYFLLRVNPIGNPRLDLEEWLNKDQFIVSSSKIKIGGQLKPFGVLTINGEQISLNPEGRFEAMIQLNPGLNVLTFKVKKFLGEAKTVAVKQIFYEVVSSTSNHLESFNGSE